jgi:hypothetical protein
VTAAEELKAIAARHRWAFDELVYSEKMIEWNQCCARTADFYEEDLFLNYEAQAVNLMQSVNAMFLYLRGCYGSGDAVLEALRALLLKQTERRKTCLIVKSAVAKKVLV